MDRAFAHLDVRSFFSIKEGAFSPESLARGRPSSGCRPSRSPTATASTAPRGSSPRVSARASARSSAPRSPCARPGRCRSRGTGAGRRTRACSSSPGTGRGTRTCAASSPTRTWRASAATPRCSPEQVCAHAGGLVALAGPSSPPGALAISGRIDAARTALDPYREAFGDRLFVAVQHRLEEGSAREVRALLRLAERAGVRAVATNPVRYLVPEDAFLADALECMRELVPISRTNVSRRNAEGWLKPAAEMRALFAERPDLITASLEIAESCGFDLALGTVRFPDFPTPAGRSASSVLAERCWRGLERREVKDTASVRDRLNHELAMIHRLGYSAYFLTVADIVADVRAMGIRCACRGSAAGSLVCFLTGISDVDAVRHDLAFERFLNPMRDELPDIDVDVESARREDVYDMVLSRYGDDRCACVAMVDTYRARAAVREVGKALGLPEPEVDTVAKAFPHIGARDLRVAIERLPELVGSNMNAGQLELLFRVAERLDGFPRHIALHPSGIVLSSDDLVRRVPLERSFQGYRVIQADKDDVELLGYLKLDVLGVRMLSSMRHALDEIARTEHRKVDLDRIPIDDEPTFELIRASDTLGCFQIESPGQRELLQKLQPTRWEDLIVDISLFRPGPGEVGHDQAVPAAPPRHGAPRLRPPVAPARAAGDVRRDRVPRAGHADPRRDGRVLAHRGRLHPPPPRSRRHAAGAGPGLPGSRHGPGRPERGRREDLGRRRAVRELRVLQGARGGLRRADLPVRLAEDPLPGALPRGGPHARPGDVPPAADPRGRAAARHPDPAARRERVRAGVRGRGRRRRSRGRRSARASGRRPQRPPRAAGSTGRLRGPVEPPPPDRRRAARYGIRLALQDVHGISDAEVRSILRRAPSGRSATSGTSCAGPRSPSRWSRRSRTPARSTPSAAGPAATVSTPP